MRFFNTTGPVEAADHYRIPPLDRLDLDELLMLVRQKRYFVLHAPRQTGKTSALLALRDRLRADGYRCAYADVEGGQTAREDVEPAMRVVLGELASCARATGDGFLDGGGPAARVDRVVIECKVLRRSLERTLADGLEQTAAYMDRCAAREGHLVVVDRGEGKRWDEKVFRRRMTSGGGTAIDVWGM